MTTEKITNAPTLRVALEWFLNPDHLPLLWAQEQARKDASLNIELIVPDDHYDGFEALAKGEVEVVVNEPLHLLEKHGDGVHLASLGTFFETDGGVLMTHEAIRRLRNGLTVRVSSPVSNPVTDGLCQDILIGWGQRQALSISREQVVVYADGFDHVQNLQNGADAAWLAFANIEGVHVRELGLPVDMITTTQGGIPGFSALDLIVSREADKSTQVALMRLVRYLEQAAQDLQRDPDAALALWYRASAQEPSDLTRAMVDDTVGRFASTIRADADRWRKIWEYMHRKGADVVPAGEYDQIFQGFSRA